MDESAWMCLPSSGMNSIFGESQSSNCGLLTVERERERNLRDGTNSIDQGEKRKSNAKLVPGKF